MRLLGVAMVRNEADVIETFVRHNLALLDGLTIVDHGSLDGTSGILAKLQEEGLPLGVESDSTPTVRQSETITRLTREALANQGADFVFTLDADEFLKLESRAGLEDALRELPGGMHAAMHWLTYVPDAFEGDPGTFGPGHLWRRVKIERVTQRKMIVGRSLLANPDDMVAGGNHVVHTKEWASVRPHALLRQEVAALAHCPVRSSAQLQAKIVVGWLAHCAAGAKGAFHWRDLYAELRDGAVLTEDRLREIACNYGLPRERWLAPAEVELVEDPVRLQAVQRYPVAAQADALRLLMRFTERLIGMAGESH